MILEYIGVYFVNFVNTLVHSRGTWILLSLLRCRGNVMLALINDVTRVEAWEHVCLWWSNGSQCPMPGPRRGSRPILRGEQFDEPHVPQLHWINRYTPSWQLRYGYAVGYVADDQGENMVAWHLNILNTIDVLVIQGWLAYRCFWYWYCGHRAQQMHNRKTWLGRQAWPYLFMSSCIIWRRLERECWSLDLDVAWLPKAKGSPWAILVPFCCLFHCCVSVHHDNI